MKLRSEMSTLTRLAIPVAIAQLLTAAAGFVDTLMAGRAGVSDLAGVAVGSALWLTVVIAPMGLFMAVNPIVGQYAGAKKFQEIGCFMHQAMRVAVVLSIILFILFRQHHWYLPFIIDDTQVRMVTGHYLEGFSWGVPALMGTFLLRPYSEGLSFTRPHLIASVISILINIPANYALIFGHWGAPKLGGAGAGWATSIAFWAAFVVMLFYSYRHQIYRKATIWYRLKPINREEMRHFFQLGLPIAMILFVEVSIFSLIALFLGVRPDFEIASHQVAMNVAYLLFTFPLSISVAVTIRVSNAVGALRRDKALLAAKAALSLAIIAASFNIFILIFFADFIPHIYSNDEVVVELAAHLLIYAGLFQMADAFVVPNQAALRGYKDTKVPLVLAIFAYWLIALPLGYILGLTDIIVPAMGAEGFWISLVVGLVISGVLMTKRLMKISKVESP